MPNAIRRALPPIAALLVALVLLTYPAAAQAAAENEHAAAAFIRERVEALLAGTPLHIAGHRIGAPAFLKAFYGQRRFAPAWLDAKNADDLIAAVDDAFADGLRPDDFYRADLRRLRRLEGLSPSEIADRDLLYTSALVRLGIQLYSGKVDPASLDRNWNLDRPRLGGDTPETIAAALMARQLPSLVAAWRPATPEYRRLRAALAAERGRLGEPWIAVPEGPTLEPGDAGARVSALRARLGLAPGIHFDDALDHAVRAFQDDHRLAADGIVGPRTLAALNTGPAQRVDTLRVNLERARWLRDIGKLDTFIAVNIAGFRLYLVENGQIVWQTRVIVGAPRRQTPLFRADMEYLVLNPTWTVPPTILRRSILPAMRNNANYLQSRGYAVYDGAGRRVDAATVDASNYRRHRVVQRPGAGNALGAVKFIFPNRHWVYIHDTPNRALFAKAERALSAGCVRVENPLELAARLLADQPAWTPDAIAAAVAGGKTKTVSLSRPIPVVLQYWTADPLGDGERIGYLADVYRRDPAILTGLDAPFAPTRDDWPQAPARPLSELDEAGTVAG